MAAQANTKARQQADGWNYGLMRFLPAWIILALVMSIMLPNLLSATFGAAAVAVTESSALVEAIVTGNTGATTSSRIAPLFTAEVQRWGDDISRWAAQYGLDPNLLATVMQIESCGDSTVASHAGAQGLFQVMPFHFAPGEVYTDPETNAKRSANFLNECLAWSNGDPNLALACYNGGPSVLQRPFHNWPAETQRYYTWGSGIYADATNNRSESPTLQSWLNAGGSNLCNRAAATQAVQ
ncbi:MAG: transglycosylase SLT domain-containing protein [Chloroflexota bacterium]